MARFGATPPVAPSAHIDEVMAEGVVCDPAVAPKFRMLRCKKTVPGRCPGVDEKSCKCGNLRSARGRLVAVVSQNVPLL